MTNSKFNIQIQSIPTQKAIIYITPKGIIEVTTINGQPFLRSIIIDDSFYNIWIPFQIIKTKDHQVFFTDPIWRRIVLKNKEKNIELDSSVYQNALILFCRLNYPSIYFIDEELKKIGLNSKQIELTKKPIKIEKIFSVTDRNKINTWLVSQGAQVFNSNLNLPKHSLYPIHNETHEIKLYSNAYDTQEHTSGAFCDIAKAIARAKKCICITSWNNCFLKDLGMGKTLGELLMDASRRGVNVFILVWDFTGAQFKEDVWIEENCRFINQRRPLNIFYKKAARNEIAQISSFLSHHQKIVLTENEGFICGLDLVPKVVDSKEHARIGREMWHDAAVMVKGPVLHDIFILFEGRWRSQPEENMLYHSDTIAKERLHSLYHSEFLQKIPKLSSEIKQCDEKKSTKSIQLLVSLSKNDYNSPHHPWNLQKPFTDEINHTILQFIDKVQNYLFITNQYFIGQYADHEDSPNQLSSALIRRIKKAYLNKKNFHVYFTLPAMPGLDPNSFSVQAYSRKQWKTIQFLLDEVNYITHHHADQYITFIELGKIHPKNHRYYQVYVHSKIMFSENDILIGSPNLNERSLAGNKDSESMLAILNYKKELDLFRNKIIEEYFGTNIFNKIRKAALLNDLSNPKVRDLIHQYLNKQLELLQRHRSHLFFDDHKHESTPSLKRSASELSLSDPSAETIFLSGCAFPFGRIHNKILSRGVKPPHLPEQSSVVLSVINSFGASQYTR